MLEMLPINGIVKRGNSNMTKPTARPALRLYVRETLVQNSTVALNDEQAHYLFKVMRRSTGDQIGMFNGPSGEVCAILEQTSKKQGVAHISGQVLPPLLEQRAKLALYFSPIKKTPMELIVRQATELGATDLHPTLMEHTRSDNVRYDRLEAIALEACEQCERLEPPTLHPPMTLDAVLAQWPDDAPCLVAAEAGDSDSMPNRLMTLRGTPNLAVMIGPEGGFSPREFGQLSSQDSFMMAGLGPRILKAETAAIAALSIVQALWGDAEQRPEFRGQI